MATSGRRAQMKEYSVPEDMLAHFGEENVEKFKASFGAFDVNGDGTIDAGELKSVIRKLGEENITDEEVGTMIAAVDTNNDNCIQFDEFLSLMKGMNLGSSGEALAEVVNKGMKMFEVKGMSTGGGGTPIFPMMRKWLSVSTSTTV